MKWQSFGQLFSILALGVFGLVVTTGCEPEAPEPVERETPTTVDGETENGVTNDSTDIDTDPDMEPTEPME